MDDDDRERTAEEEVAGEPPAQQAGPSGDLPLALPSQPGHLLPPSSSRSTAAPTKKPKAFMTFHLPSEMALDEMLNNGGGMSASERNLVLITEAPAAFQTRGPGVLGHNFMCRSTAVRHRDRWWWIELHSKESSSTEKCELPISYHDSAGLTHSATVFHSAAKAEEPDRRGDDVWAEQVWRNHAARGQAWRRPGWDGSVGPEEVARRILFAQLASVAEDEPKRARHGKVDEENNFGLECSDD